MTNDVTARIARDPRFIAVARRRNRLAWTLFAITMALFFGLVVTATLHPAALATPLWAGGTTSIGWPLGAAVIVVPWLLTLVYIRRSDADGREMTRIVEEART